MRKTLFTAVAAFTFISATASAQTLHLLLLDGRTGKPIPSTLVRVTKAEPPYGFFDPIPKPTYSDPQGGLSFPNQPKDIQQFAVSVEQFYPCGSVKTNFSFEEVRRTGTVSENTCKSKITHAAIPGTLILYLRPYTLFERYRTRP